MIQRYYKQTLHATVKAYDCTDTLSSISGECNNRELLCREQEAMQSL